MKKPVGRPKLNNVVFYARCSPEQKSILEEVATKLKQFPDKETETEYISRIQSMHLEKCSNECLKDMKSKEK